MKRTFFLFLLTISLSCSLSVMAWDSLQKETLLRVYLDSLSMISHDLLLLDYRLNTDVDRERILSDIERNKRLVEKPAFSELNPPDELVQKLDRFLIHRVHRLLKQQELRPTPEELQDYYQSHPEEFQVPESLEGARILIEYATDMQEQAAALQEILESSPLSFREIAADYYQSRGKSQDGYFGWVHRGSIREDLFELFIQANPEDKYFGPVETRHGLLFGKLYQTRPGYLEPFENVQSRLERILLKNKLQDDYTRFYEQEMEHFQVQYLYDADSPTVPPRDIPVLQTGDRPWTYQEILDANPDVMGDVNSPEFFQAVARRTIEHELLYRSEEAQLTRESEEYHFLREAFIAQWKVYETIEEEYSKLQVNEEVLRDFYEKHKVERYTAPEGQVVPFKDILSYVEYEYRKAEWDRLLSDLESR